MRAAGLADRFSSRPTCGVNPPLPGSQPPDAVIATVDFSRARTDLILQMSQPLAGDDQALEFCESVLAGADFHCSFVVEVVRYSEVRSSIENLDHERGETTRQSSRTSIRDSRWISHPVLIPHRLEIGWLGTL